MAIDKIKKATQRRKHHIRKKIFGTSERPRLTIFRSNKHVYAQVIDDVAGATLVSASTRGKAIRDDIGYGGNIKAAEKIGAEVAKEAMSVGIKCVCFDRNGYRFHGRCKALAESAKKAGLVF